jgi:hypothetical protein
MERRKADGALEQAVEQRRKKEQEKIRTEPEA